jgi:G3E family GTPase
MGEDGLRTVEGRIRRINPYAAIHRTERCGIELRKVRERGAFNLDLILEVEPGFLTEDHDHEHDDRISSLCLVAGRPMARLRGVSRLAGDADFARDGSDSRLATKARGCTFHQK